MLEQNVANVVKIIQYIQCVCALYDNCGSIVSKKSKVSAGDMCDDANKLYIYTVLKCLIKTCSTFWRQGCINARATQFL